MLIFNLFNSALYAGTGYSADPDCDCDPDSQCRGFFGSPPFYPLPSYDCVTRTLRIGQISHMEIKFSSSKIFGNAIKMAVFIYSKSMLNNV